jgi:hypothetical protein
MLEDSYLCEANIEAAQILMDREWEKRNASAALIMVNCCNDLFKPLGMDFTDEKKITDN